MSFENDIKVDTIIQILFSWLEKSTSTIDLAWLEQKSKDIRSSASEIIFFTSYSLVSRHFNQEKLYLPSEDLSQASTLVTGCTPSSWTFEQAARTILLRSFPTDNIPKYLAALDKLIEAADVREAIAFYQSLSLLPYPEKFQLRAAVGIRSNMTSVFNSVALNNPYPAKYLADLAWNQMILKALFVGSPLKLIYGLEQRNNQELSQMLIDYACERLSANRTVSLELWKLVMPFQPEAVSKLKQATIQV